MDPHTPRSELAVERLPEVAIVGRPNVGKSTLFNRVLGRRQAIVGRQAGLTRDRHRSKADWCGRHFVLTDTGGIDWDSADELLRRIRGQALDAIEDADVVLLIVDGREGLLPVESELTRELRRRQVSVLVVVNKCDTPGQAQAFIGDFHALGLQPVVAISAEHGVGVGRLLDELVKQLPAGLPLPEDEQGVTPTDSPAEPVGVAVVGRPNVGKSSLVNALLGSERVVVSEVPGTTRDSIDCLLESKGRLYKLIDTAGLRRGGRRDSYAEIASVAVARKRMRVADVALAVTDAQEGLTRQDLHIIAEAEGAGCAIIVVVNKWDLIPPEEALTLEWVQAIRRRLARMGYTPCAFISAKTGDGVENLLPLIDRVQANRCRRLPTAQLNAVFQAIVSRGVADGGPGMPRPKYITQVRVRPPTFAVFTVGGKRTLQRSYQRYLENRLREAFDFTGTPVVLRIRRASQRRG